MRRSATRVEARERAVARSESLSATDEIVARAEVQRAVVDAVLGLAEPYRTTVLMRFFDELPAEEIAKRRGEPVETVRTRIKRGLASLREHLSRELVVETNEGRRWSGLQALTLILDPTRGGTLVTATAGSGITLMAANAKFAVGALVAVSVAATIMVTMSARSEPGSDSIAIGRTEPMASQSSADGNLVPRREEELSEAAASTAGDAASLEKELDERQKWLDRLKAELTMRNLDELQVGDDLGVETRSAFHGLRYECLNLEALTTYVISRLEEAWIVPESWSERGRPEAPYADWRMAYPNSSGGASVAHAWVTSQNQDSVNFELRVHAWGSEIAAEFAHATWIRLVLYREPGTTQGVRSGQIGIYPEPVPDVPVVPKFSELEKKHEVGSTVFLSLTPSEGRLIYRRTGASQQLTTQEHRDLNALFTRMFDLAKQRREENRATAAADPGER